MYDSHSTAALTTLQIVDLPSDASFRARETRPRDPWVEIIGMQRLARVFARQPERILQELVDISVDLCGADGAGVSVEEPCGSDDTQFRWIANAGSYSHFAGAVLPRLFSPCATCLDRGNPQLFRVPREYLDKIGVDAPAVTNGILIPWIAGDIRGTLWIIAHGSYTRFDRDDFELIRNLSDFAAIAVRHQRQCALLTHQAAAQAGVAMANHLAYQINNPLQGVMQTVYLAAQGGPQAEHFARQAMDDLTRLAGLLNKLLTLPNPA